MKDNVMLNIRIAGISILLLCLLSSQAQRSNLSRAVKQFNSEAHKSQAWNNPNTFKSSNIEQPFESGVKQYLEKFSPTYFRNIFSKQGFSTDSMFIIGATPAVWWLFSGTGFVKLD